MAELNIETGLVKYNINGVCEITFNPTDTEFIAKLYKAFDDLDALQNEYKNRIQEAQGSREIFDVAREMDAKMRDICNDAFGFDVCTAVFGAMNVFAMAGGLPVWANLLLAILDEVDTGVTREQKLMNPKIRKYTDKYKAK